MPSLLHSARDPTQRQLGQGESNVDYFDQIALSLPILETLGVVQATQRTLKGEVGPRLDQAVNFSEDQSTGRYRCELRTQRRNSTGNQIGINEVNEPGNFRQIVARKGCLSRSIRSGDDNTAWLS